MIRTTINGASIKINGEFSLDQEVLENEVIFEGDRLEPIFEDVPGQWGTIWLFDGSINNEISYANYTLQIPTNPEFKSLNLSHSLIIIAQYVSSIIKSKTSHFKKSKKVIAASKKEIHSMTNLCIQNLDEINFFKPKEKKPIMLENLRNIFYRMELSAKETRILSSVFASLGKKR